MIEKDHINEAVRHIIDKFAPERIILFGSYAYGQPAEDSDVDLLVIMPFEGSHTRKAVEILNEIDPHFAIDLLVRTPEQLRQRLAWSDFFLREIMERGTVLYAAPDGGVDSQSGRRLEVGAARDARS